MHPIPIRPAQTAPRARARLRMCRCTPGCVGPFFPEVQPVEKRVRLDPVFASTSYRCSYCGADLLADVEVFLLKVREHFVPRSAGGPDAAVNRLPSCGPCDRLKGGRVFGSVEEARVFLAEQRAGWRQWVARLRQVVSPAVPG